MCEVCYTLAKAEEFLAMFVAAIAGVVSIDQGALWPSVWFIIASGIILLHFLGLDTVNERFHSPYYPGKALLTLFIWPLDVYLIAKRTIEDWKLLNTKVVCSNCGAEYQLKDLSEWSCRIYHDQPKIEIKFTCPKCGHRNHIEEAKK